MQILIAFIKRNSITWAFLICALLAYYHIADCSRIYFAAINKNYESAALFYLIVALFFLILTEYIHYYKRKNKDINSNE